jgi:hemolysin III
MTITIREPGSALTHFAGVILAIFAAFPLLIKAAIRGNALTVTAMAVFMSSMLLLYSASTLYHSISFTGAALKKFRKMDHMMIFVMIAGSYTPVCLLKLDGRKGMILLVAIWTLALVGMTVKYCWITCPKWFSSVIYIAMGWTCVFVLPELRVNLPAGAFAWLLAGGIVYTAGGVIYALKLPLFKQRPNFGNHELFHLFVLGGSICHYICMYCFLAD